MADWQLGDIVVTSILEQVAEFMTLDEFFDGFTSEMFEANKDWLLPEACDTLIQSSFTSMGFWGFGVYFD